MISTAFLAGKNVKSLIGIPYERMNCWEAVRDYYKLQYDIELKHYCEGTPDDRDDIRNLIYSSMGDFELVSDQSKMMCGDLILFKVRGIESHIGVYHEVGKFFHSSKTTGSCIDRMDRWKHLVVGVYRLKAA